ncbi:MAG: TRAP transporter small permease [Lachnospiraceae bacterium]|nr:TRAP transporter small permease [Lachnospiraceae bacterium]
MEKSKNIFDKVVKIFEWVSTFSLALMTLLITLQVVFRYVLSSPLAWTEELARYAFIWMTFVASVVAAVKGEHVAITMLQDKCRGWIKIIMLFISNAITAVFFVIVGYYSLSQWSKLSMQTSAALKIPMNYVYLGIIVGSICMAVWYFYCGIRAIVLETKNCEKSNSFNE